MHEPEPAENSNGADTVGPRTETFLARYPRKLKVGILGGAVALLLLPLMALHHPRHHGESGGELAEGPGRKTSVEGDEHQNGTSTLASDENAGNPSTHSEGPVVALNEQDDSTLKLTPSPDPLLTEEAEGGSLPRIGQDGRKPWQVYARPYNAGDNRPRIAIVVADMGMARFPTEAAINRLPRNVTLAFNSQSPVVGAWCARARQAGHEVILDIAMEPFDYPRSDPGTHTLLTTLSNVDNLGRLNWALRQGSGYIGVTTLSGSRFTTTNEKFMPILATLKARGLMVLDARIAPYSVVAALAREQEVPAATSAGRLDQDLSADAIDATLAALEQLAQKNGRAVGVVAPFPLMLERLDVWMKGLPKRGISLAPLSAVTQ